MLYYNLLPCFIQLEMHVRLICAIKFYLLTYLLTYFNTARQHGCNVILYSGVQSHAVGLHG